MNDNWLKTKKLFTRLRLVIHSWIIAILRKWLTKLLDPYVPEDHELLHLLVDERLKILGTRTCMFNKPIDPKDCDHAGVWFGSGDYYIFCYSCNSRWVKSSMGIDKPDPSVANRRVPSFDQSEPRVLLR